MPASVPANGRTLLLRVLGHLLPGWGSFLLIVFCVLMGAMVNLIPPLMIRVIIDHALPTKDLPELYLTVGVIIGVALLGGGLGVWRNYLATRIGQQVIFDLRCRLYKRLVSQSLSFFTQARTGEITSRIQNDVGGIQAIVNGTLITAFANFILIVSTLVLIFLLNWRLALLASIVLPVFIFPARYAGAARSRISQQIQEKIADLNAFLQEKLSVRGFLLLRLFGKQDTEIGQFERKAAVMRELQIRESMVGRWFLMWIMLFSTVGPALIYMVGGRQVIQGEATVGTIVAFVAYLGQLYAPMSVMASTHLEILGSLAIFRRIFEYLDAPCDMSEPAHPILLSEPAGCVKFDNVSMAYAPGKIAVESISFEARPGEMLALVGPSGAGKTTVAYLASRLHDPSSGVVTFDGVDLRKLRLADVSHWITKVSQETMLFHASVAENLRYARPHATQAELERVCSLAQIHEVIAALPQGYATTVGERGYKLSGGERQRLAIARALLRDPKVLILDEATSSLDSRSEALVQRALEVAFQGRTSIVIAHRISTILRADQILVFDNGHIVERGRHRELFELGGLYTKLYTSQFRASAQVNASAVAHACAADTE